MPASEIALSMFEGRLISIHTSAIKAEKTNSRPEVLAVAGKGLEGDRYFSESGTFSGKATAGRQVTLIEIEALESLERDNHIGIAPGDARRNLVTRDVPLNHLVGREFYVGDVRLRGVMLCEPCAHLQSLTKDGVLSGLLHRGGLRADILSGGMIRKGDPIRLA